MKLSYAHGTSDVPLIGETIGENLRRTVEKFPDREALVVAHQDYRATYRQLWDQTTILAKALMAQGIDKGDRVGIWAPNRYEWVLIQFAAARMGAILVNVNPGYKTAGLKYALEQSQIKLLIAAQAFRDSSYVEILNRVRPECHFPEITVIIEKDWGWFVEEGKKISDDMLLKREKSLEFDDPINIQYTSGTTGFSKGATLSHHNILNNGYFVGERISYTENDRVCIPVPFYHCFGMVMGNLACSSHGACMVIPGEFFEPAQTLKTIQDEKCTSLYGVPTMFIAELALPDFDRYDLSSLRTGIMAGSPCPEDTMKQVQSRMNMSQVTVAYGMTETSPVSTQSNADDPLDKRVSTVGQVMPHLEIKIINTDTGRIAFRGERGEFCTRGYSVMIGYWDNEEATKQSIDPRGWMHTGDEAVMDDDGYVKITGRIKDTIIRGGENIPPREIEEFLIGHEAVINAQVIGVPSEKYGEEVMAWVHLRDGSHVTQEDLVEYCKGQLATFMIPRFWKFVKEFPMTVTGKIRKVEMREISAQELGLDHIKNSIQSKS